MKKIVALVVAFIALGLVSRAQCDKKIKWIASKTEFVDASGNVNTKDGPVEVTTGRDIQPICGRRLD